MGPGSPEILLPTASLELVSVGTARLRNLATGMPWLSALGFRGAYVGDGISTISNRTKATLARGAETKRLLLESGATTRCHLEVAQSTVLPLLCVHTLDELSGL